MPVLFIEEEYGYREWVADLTAKEWDELVARWQTIRGLNCLVPVRLIVPQARQIVWGKFDSPDFGKDFHESHNRATHFAHIHEHDDSFLSGIDYEIPKTDDESFHMDGKSWTRDDILAMMRQEQQQENSETQP
jgi:hypothetical protein